MTAFCVFGLYIIRKGKKLAAVEVSSLLWLAARVEDHKGGVDRG
jgi:hypothetical protein